MLLLFCVLFAITTSWNLNERFTRATDTKKEKDQSDSERNRREFTDAEESSSHNERRV